MRTPVLTYTRTLHSIFVSRHKQASSFAPTRFILQEKRVLRLRLEVETRQKSSVEGLFTIWQGLLQ